MIEFLMGMIGGLFLDYLPKKKMSYIKIFSGLCAFFFVLISVVFVILAMLGKNPHDTLLQNFYMALLFSVGSSLLVTLGIKLQQDSIAKKQKVKEKL